MERYNPLAEGHIERAGRTSVNERPIYTVAEPLNANALKYLKGYKYVEGKYTTIVGKVVHGWVYNPPPPTAAPEPEAPEPTPEPEPETVPPMEQCEKCGREGDDLKIFDSDSEVYGVVCPCGHMWLSSLHPKK
jgi:hypothetical protein